MIRQIYDMTGFSAGNHKAIGFFYCFYKDIFADMLEYGIGDQIIDAFIGDHAIIIKPFGAVDTVQFFQVTDPILMVFDFGKLFLSSRPSG